MTRATEKGYRSFIYPSKRPRAGMDVRERS